MPDLDDDAAFDASLSEAALRVSAVYWTPVVVARVASRWLSEAGVQTVLDVGSGVGKLCIVAALASSELQLTGVEHRAHLVTEASRLARHHGVADRTHFVAGTIADVDATRFDALYLFNPFSEHVYPAEARIDSSVELSAERMAMDVRALEDVLDRMRVGAMLLTYHGFRGAIPDTFDLTRWKILGDSVLRAWVKQRERRGGFRWVEVGDDLTMSPGEIDP